MLSLQQKCFGGLLRQNGIAPPVYPELVSFCVDACSIKKTREEEKASGGAIHADGLKLSGSFARSGKVGQWQDFFNRKDVEYIKRKLVDGGVAPEQFWLTSC